MAKVGDLYTLDSAAKQLALSYWQLWRRIHKNNIPTVRVGKSILVKLADVQQVATQK